MALAFRVSVPFSRKDPKTRKMVEYQKGDLIADPAMIDGIRDSEHAAHGHVVTLPDDHHDVLPHLAEDHPVRVAHMEKVMAGQDEAVAAKPKREPKT